MKEKLQSIKEEALAQIQAADAPEKLNDVKVRFLGKKGELTAVLKGMKDVNVFFENGMYKYTIGEDTDHKKIQELRKKNLDKFPNAFLIAFRGNRKLNAKETQEARK